MDMKKQKKEEVANQMSYFDCLPEELILSILSKMDDLKILCQCLLVSKSFASMIYRVRKVSLSLPSMDMNSLEAHSDMSKFYHEVICFNSEEIPLLIQSSPDSPHKKLNFCIILQNFKELKSIHVEFTCPKSNCSSLLKWKAMYRSSGSMVERLVALLPASIHKKSKHESVDDELEDQEGLIDFLKTEAKDCALLPFSCCREWLVVLCLLIKFHSTFRSVTITDTHKHGIFVLKNEKLVEWRKSLICKKFAKRLVPKPFMRSWVPLLHLPISGYFMKGVMFMIMDFKQESDAIMEYGDPMTWEYDGEEQVLGETVREILTNHRDRIL